MNLYRHFDGSGKLLYVGISLNQFSRLGQHKANSIWFDEIATITTERCKDKESALRKEARAIRKEKPLHNSHHNHKARRPMMQASKRIKQPSMTVSDAIKHYGGKRKLAVALNISPSAVTHWITAGKIPELHQYKLQALTAGKLKVGNGK